jgi:hypothetical protein
VAVAPKRWRTGIARGVPARTAMPSRSSFSRPIGEAMQAAMHVCIFVRINMLDAIQHALQLLRRGGVIEADQRLATDLGGQNREVLGTRAGNCAGGLGIVFTAVTQEQCSVAAIYAGASCPLSRLSPRLSPVSKTNRHSRLQGSRRDQVANKERTMLAAPETTPAAAVLVCRHESAVSAWHPGATR